LFESWLFTLEIFLRKELININFEINFQCGRGLRILRKIADNSDLSLTIEEDGYKGTPMTFAGFAFMWTGVRSTFGVKQGKVCFQVKVSRNLCKVPPQLFSARCNIYISRLCYDASVRLSVTEVHWRIIANLGFIFRSHFTTHCAGGSSRAMLASSRLSCLWCCHHNCDICSSSSSSKCPVQLMGSWPQLVYFS